MFTALAYSGAAQTWSAVPIAGFQSPVGIAINPTDGTVAIGDESMNQVREHSLLPPASRELVDVILAAVTVTAGDPRGTARRQPQRAADRQRWLTRRV